MKIKVDLRGWADGLGDDPKKIYFPLQMAMYAVTHDCDWNFEVKTEGEFVYKPFTIYVKARRCHSAYCDLVRNTNTRNYTYREFEFMVPQFTLANIYMEAVRALKC